MLKNLISKIFKINENNNSQDIENNDKCKSNIIKNFEPWNFIDRKNKNANVDVSVCNSTGIVLSSVKFLNNFIYFNLFITILTIITVFSFDYIFIIGKHHKIYNVSLIKKKINNIDGKPLMLKPYEIQSPYYVCGDIRQRWSEEWLKKDKKYRSPIITDDLAEKSNILENINCQKFYHKGIICGGNDENRLKDMEITENEIIGSNSLHSLDFTKGNKCNTSSGIKLEEINYKKKLCQRIDYNDSNLSKTIINIKRFYFLFVCIISWIITIQMIFENQNIMIKDSINWFSVVGQFYGIIYPLFIFSFLFINPKPIYKFIDLFAETHFNEKWENHKQMPKSFQVRNLVGITSFIIIYIMNTIYILSKIHLKKKFNTKSQMSFIDFFRFFSNVKDLNNKNSTHKLKILINLMLVIGMINYGSVFLTKKI